MKSINEIKVSDWMYLLCGLQEKLDLTQKQLLTKFQLNGSRNSLFSKWLNGRNAPSYRNKLKIIEFVNPCGLDITNLIVYGKKMGKGLKIGDNWTFPIRTYKRDDFGDDLIIRKNDKLFLSMPLLFPTSFKSHNLEFILKDGKVVVFYREKRSTRPEPLVLPRFLELNKDFLVGLGIYLSEGAKNRKPKITNSEPVIINQAIKFFELIGVSKSKLRSWIQLHERSSKSFDEAREFWLDNTYLKKKNIGTIRIKKSMGSGKIKQYGVLHLESNFILSQLLIKGLLDLIPDILKFLSKQQVICFLQGAFAGDGYVNIAKSGSVNVIQYTSTNTRERRMIKSLLTCFGLKVHENNSTGDLKVTGYINIKKLVEFDIFKYNLWRRDKLLVGFDKLSNSSVPGFNKERILKFLFKNSSCAFTTDEVCKKFNLARFGVFRHLNELYRAGKIKKICGSGPIPNTWFV